PGGTDTAASRWLIGEDLAGGAIRSMSNPSLAPFSDPDRMTSSNFKPAVTYPRGTPGSPDNNDQGGVHSNSGVGNKLCFLLCDGGVFNGQNIIALGDNMT